MSHEEAHLDLSASLPEPYITDDLPGIGGNIKKRPEHFVVQELPLYEATGDGAHIYVCVTRDGWTTRALQQRLAALFSLQTVDVGYAGLKDKQARVTQVFSLCLPNTDERSVHERIESELPLQVACVRRHRNKLKPGHLLGNRFQIVVSHPVAEALERSDTVIAALHHRGIPNFYGVQRFGVTGENAQRGREILLGAEQRDRWLRRFLLSAYQSALFNAWLSARIRQGWFQQVMLGDVAKKTQTGGLFEVADVATDTMRFARNEITITGPIYGSKMWWASDAPGKLEHSILEHSGITVEMLGRASLKGTRRPARLVLESLVVLPHPEGVELRFDLPKGAYATTVLREFIKADLTVCEDGTWTGEND
ncbi:MAG: tRNA pseudouridine(13) synthase TruD [Chloroflexi bacterium]|nr:tRNA pseudouridine(13) synthase TruD [Chloroflexota bacterium]